MSDLAPFLSDRTSLMMKSDSSIVIDFYLLRAIIDSKFFLETLRLETIPSCLECNELLKPSWLEGDLVQYLPPRNCI